MGWIQVMVITARGIVTAEIEDRIYLRRGEKVIEWDGLIARVRAPRVRALAPSAETGKETPK